MINRAKMPRQMYGLGSLVKDRIRKLIPNELASVAVKAAPFVAPFSPKTAALMRGIGRFDQRGSISDALKQGAATFGFGVGARTLGGAESAFGDFSLSTPLNEERTQALGRLFDRRAADPKITPEDLPGGPDASKFKTIIKKNIKKLPERVVGQLIAGGVTAGASLLASYFQGEFREQEPGETMEEYLAARKDVVGKQMRTYMDNYYANDPEYSALDDAGRNAFVARYNVRDGGMPMGIMRTNKAGVMERDYRDKGGFVPVGIKEKADDVPAMLSKNEFVMTADAVRGAGNGSIEKGAQKMYDTMKNLERRVT